MTISSSEENELVWNAMLNNGLNPGGTNNYQSWIGLYQNMNSPDFSEPNGGWEWVNGEAVEFYNWAPGQPNNFDNGYFAHISDNNCTENIYGEMIENNECGTWDDAAISTNLQSAFYVLEKSIPQFICSSSDEISVTINICGCTDSEAVNYNIEANEDDSSCCYDIDYVNDTYDEGYADGVDSVICPENNCPADLTLDGIVSTADLLMFLVSFGTICEVTDECGVINGDGSTCADLCGEPVSHEGYDYSTVQIGEQCWFSENCRYLPTVSPSIEGNDTDPYYYVYDYQGTDLEEAQATANYETYGVLYNWPAVMTDEICPTSWHVPSDEEFTELTDFLGGESGAGSAMKSTSGWNSDSNGSNSSGFNGLPGGILYSDIFYDNGSYGYWWTSSEFGSGAWVRFLHSADAGRDFYERYFGLSARCIKD